MVTKIISLLIASYKQDLEEYSKLKLKMQELSNFLEQSPNNEKGEKSPIEDNESQLNEDFEKKILEFCSYREKTFEDLKQRTVKAKALQIQACSEAGVISFEIARFEPHLSKPIYRELVLTVKSFREKLAEILEMDKIILHTLAGELEKIRLEIYRIEGVKKTRNAYENKRYKDALFIDRTK